VTTMPVPRTVTMQQSYSNARRRLQSGGHLVDPPSAPPPAFRLTGPPEGAPRRSFPERLRPPLDRPALEVRRFYEAHSVAPPAPDLSPVLQFEEIDFGPAVTEWLRGRFAAPTPIQAVAWPTLLLGNDAVALAPTGSGKTLAYALPALAHLAAGPPTSPGQGPICLILTATQELVLQTAAVFAPFERSMGFQVAAVYGGREAGGNIVAQGAKLWTGCEVVVATPSRLTELMAAGLCPLDRVRMLVLDEADALLARADLWESTRAIVQQTPPDRQTVLFSATWMENIPPQARDLLTHPVSLSVGRVDGRATTTAASAIEQRFVFPVGDHLDREDLLLDVLRDVRAAHPGRSKVVVFVNGKPYAETVIRGLQQIFPGVLALHRDVPPAERQAAMAALRGDPNTIIVATDLAARGLSIPDLTCVVNFQLPLDFPTYVHRIGRAKAFAVSFVTDDDRPLYGDLVKGLKATNQPVPRKLMEGLHRSGQRIERELANPKSRRAKLTAAGFTAEEIARGIRIVPRHLMDRKDGPLDYENWRPPTRYNR